MEQQTQGIAFKATITAQDTVGPYDPTSYLTVGWWNAVLKEKYGIWAWVRRELCPGPLSFRRMQKVLSIVALCAIWGWGVALAAAGPG